MPHYASGRFWAAYRALPADVRELADKTYDLLDANPQHPSVRLKKVGSYWSARVGAGHRALAVEVDDGLLWFWIGTHADYDRIVGR